MTSFLFLPPAPLDKSTESERLKRRRADFQFVALYFLILCFYMEKKFNKHAHEVKHTPTQK